MSCRPATNAAFEQRTRFDQRSGLVTAAAGERPGQRSCDRVWLALIAKARLDRTLAASPDVRDFTARGSSSIGTIRSVSSLPKGTLSQVPRAKAADRPPEAETVRLGMLYLHV